MDSYALSLQQASRSPRESSVTSASTRCLLPTAKRLAPDVDAAETLVADDVRLAEVGNLDRVHICVSLLNHKSVSPCRLLLAGNAGQEAFSAYAARC